MQLSITEFSGINRADGTLPGEWEKLRGMNFSRGRALVTCPPPLSAPVISGCTGYTVRDGGIAYTTADGLHYGEDFLPLTLSGGKKTLVSMGAYIVIIPDWIKVNLSNMTAEKYNDKNRVLRNAVLLEANYNRTRPYIDIGKRLYISVAANDAGLADYAVGDRVRLEWTSTAHGSRSLCATISDISPASSGDRTEIDFLWQEEYPDTTYYYTTKGHFTDVRMHAVPQTTMNVTVSKVFEVPLDADTDDNGRALVTEHNNRLWACSSAKHEIYCSALGDPFAWKEYKGLSTDSFAVTVGSDGDFTGIAVYCDSVLFFKENCVHIIYGSKASNFTLSTLTLRGVQKNSADSLCVSNGLLYYKAPEGFFCFNGTAATRIDNKLGEDIKATASAAANDSLIAFALSDGRLYCFDNVKGEWYTATLAGVTSGHSIGGRLYFARKSGASGVYMTELLYRTPTADVLSDTSLSPASVGFTAESGWLLRGGEHTVIKKLIFNMDEGAAVFRIEICTENMPWTTVYESGAAVGGSGTLINTAISPVRCQQMKVRISGSVAYNTVSDAAGGRELCLYGIYIETEGGSEIGGKY